jgi:predicted nucleic acid-binding protein
LKIALDTNILAYGEGVNDAEKRDAVFELLDDLPQGSTVVPVQVLGELFNVLVRKARRSRAETRDALLAWRDTFPTVETTPEVMLAAVDLATDHHFSIWDAVILAAASQAGCRLLLSEDLQDGFTWGGVTVVNPFAAPRHPLLSSLLDGSTE